MGNLSEGLGRLPDDAVGTDYCVSAVDPGTREEHEMSTTPPGLRSQDTTRTVFRVVGVVLLLLALTFLALGLQSFFAAFGSDDPGFPSRFWMAFVGVLMLAPAGWCLQAGFIGAASRYVAGETTPVLKESAAYLTDGQGILGVGRTVDDGDQAATGPFCSTCGVRNDADARFCDSCGAPLGR
jgi:hypothetical protein